MAVVAIPALAEAAAALTAAAEGTLLVMATIAAAVGAKETAGKLREWAKAKDEAKPVAVSGCPPPDDPCGKLYQQMNEEINAKRPPTPPGGRPQGKQGLAERWRQFADPKNPFGTRPDGSLGKDAQNHLNEYLKQRDLLKELLDRWDKKKCGDKFQLPDKARNYADKAPEHRSGQLEP
jgi:hypothetical protein